MTILGFGQTSSNHKKLRLMLLLSIVLVGAAFLYPSLYARQQRSQIQSLLAVNELDEAQIELRQLLAWKEPDADSSLLQAIIARRSNRAEQFTRYLNEANELGASAKMLDFQTQLLDVQNGNIDRATELELTATAAEFGADDIAAQTYEAIARGYLSSYQLKEAWQCLTYWLEWKPKDIPARLMRCEIYDRTGRMELAVEEYREILKDAPNNKSVKLKLASILLKINEVDQAASLLREVCAEPLAPAEPQMKLADAEFRLGNLEIAQAAIERAMQLGLDPAQRAECNSLLGRLALANQQPQEAVDYLLVAIELAPQDAVAQLSLGRALTLTGNSELGAIHTERSVKIRNSYEEIQGWTQAVIEQPDNPELRTNIGRALVEQGMRAEGIRWIETALVCDRNYAPAIEFLKSITLQ